MDLLLSNLKNNIIIILIVLLGGCLYQIHLDSIKIKDIESKYVQSVKQAREQEAIWRNLNEESLKNYQEEVQRLTDVNTSLSNAADRLREQLSSYSSRVSSNTTTPGRVNEGSRESKLAGKITELVTFSEQCARRTDELILQINSLQQWAKSINKKD